MGTWNYMFDSDMLQRMDLERLAERASFAEARIRRVARAHGERVEELEREVGEMALVLRALIGMLKEKGGFDAAAFNAAFEKIDAEDGVIDGRVTPEDQRPAPPRPPAPPVQAPVPRRSR
jgi:hypothetical protein